MSILVDGLGPRKRYWIRVQRRSLGPFCSLRALADAIPKLWMLHYPPAVEELGAAMRVVMTLSGGGTELF